MTARRCRETSIVLELFRDFLNEIKGTNQRGEVSPYEQSGLVVALTPPRRGDGPRA